MECWECRSCVVLFYVCFRVCWVDVCVRVWDDDTNGGKSVGRGVLSPTIAYSFEVFVLVVWMLLSMWWFCFVHVCVGERTPRPTEWLYVVVMEGFGLG